MMRHHLHGAAVIAFAFSSAAVAQQTTSTTTQQTPTQTQTQTTTTNSTTTAIPGTTSAPAQTQTTTTKNTTTTPTDPATGAQTAPAESSATTTTTTTQAAAIEKATAADVVKGASVYDEKGGTVGTIESVSAKGAIVSTGKVRVPIPVASFAKNDKGLVISMTKAELEAKAPAATTEKKPAPKKTK